MLIIRFKETFRERVSEWLSATAMIAWGMLTIASPGLFAHQPFFKPLLNIMPQDAWGTAATFIGFLRIIFLVINGAWRPSAHIRAIGCVLGTMLWGSLFLSALAVGWVAPTAALSGALLGSDLISLWFTAGDAKLADLSVRSKLRAQ